MPDDDLDPMDALVGEIVADHALVSEDQPDPREDEAMQELAGQEPPRAPMPRNPPPQHLGDAWPSGRGALPPDVMQTLDQLGAGANLGSPQPVPPQPIAGQTGTPNARGDYPVDRAQVALMKQEGAARRAAGPLKYEYARPDDLPPEPQHAPTSEDGGAVMDFTGEDDAAAGNMEVGEPQAIIDGQEQNMLDPGFHRVRPDQGPLKQDASRYTQAHAAGGHVPGSALEDPEESSLWNTLADDALSYGQGAAMGNVDNLADLSGIPHHGQRVRDRMQLANERSPVTSTASELAGNVASGAALTATGMSLPAAAGLQGAASAIGAANPDSADDAAWAALGGGAEGVVLGKGVDAAVGGAVGLAKKGAALAPKVIRSRNTSNVGAAGVTGTDFDNLVSNKGEDYVNDLGQWIQDHDINRGTSGPEWFQNLPQSVDTFKKNSAREAGVATGKQKVMAEQLDERGVQVDTEKIAQDLERKAHHKGSLAPTDSNRLGEKLANEASNIRKKSTHETRPGVAAPSPPQEVDPMLDVYTPYDPKTPTSPRKHPRPGHFTHQLPNKHSANDNALPKLAQERNGADVSDWPSEQVDVPIESAGPPPLPPAPTSHYTGKMPFGQALGNRKEFDANVNWAQPGGSVEDGMGQAVNRAGGQSFRHGLNEAIEGQAPEMAESWAGNQSHLGNALSVQHPAASRYWKDQGNSPVTSSGSVGASVGGIPGMIAAALTKSRGRAAAANMKSRVASGLEAAPEAIDGTAPPIAGVGARELGEEWGQRFNPATAREDDKQQAAQASENARGHLMGEAAVKLLATKPEEFGPWRGKFEAARDKPEQMRALLQKMQHDVMFRRGVGRKLQEMTAEGAR
jgi:hypothetical protein